MGLRHINFCHLIQSKQFSQICQQSYGMRNHIEFTLTCVVIIRKLGIFTRKKYVKEKTPWRMINCFAENH